MNTTKSKTEEYTCLKCTSNKISCKSCTMIESCVLCGTCNSSVYEQCVHCIVDCDYLKTCTMRSPDIFTRNSPPLSIKNSNINEDIVDPSICQVVADSFACLKKEKSDMCSIYNSLLDLRDPKTHNICTKIEEISMKSKKRNTLKKQDKIIPYNENYGGKDSSDPCHECEYNSYKCENCSAFELYCIPCEICTSKDTHTQCVHCRSGCLISGLCTLTPKRWNKHTIECGQHFVLRDEMIQYTKQSSALLLNSKDHIDTTDTIWDSEIKVECDCPHKQQIKFMLSERVTLKLEYLQKTFPSHEFVVYGNAISRGDREYFLEDIYIPKQDVGYASCDNVEVDGNYNTVIHKHPGKSPGGFSKQDEETINLNHQFSLLFGSSSLDEYVSSSRIQVSCGIWMKVELQLSKEKRELKDESFFNEVKKIKTLAEHAKWTSPYTENSKYAWKKHEWSDSYYNWL